MCFFYSLLLIITLTRGVGYIHRNKVYQAREGEREGYLLFIESTTSLLGLKIHFIFGKYLVIYIKYKNSYYQICKL